MNNKLRTVSIKAGGYWIPEEVIGNLSFSHINDISDKWIKSRTGISERRRIASGESTSDLAFQAGKKALENSGLTPDEVDCIIVATSSPDRFFPSTASQVQAKLGAKNAGAFDLYAACSGFIYALQSGYNMVASGLFNNVMVIGAEALTRLVNMNDKNTAVLFGDGAGGVILSEGSQGQIISFDVGTNGEGASILSIPAGGTRLPASKETVENDLHCIHMNGKETYKACIRSMTNSIKKLLKKLDLTIADIDHLITHQANERIIEAVVKKLKFPQEKVHMLVRTLGNTGAASIPICLCSKMSEFQPGDKILLAAFGAGFTWGSCIIKW